MPYKHIVSESELERILTEAADNDHDVDGVREMYWTPEEAVGNIIQHHLHWGRTFCEVTDVDMEEETVTLSELFTDREFTVSTDDSLDTIFIGGEFTVEWIEARIDGEWERVSDYATPTDPLGLYIKTDEDISIEDTRRVSKTYVHKTAQYDAWPIRVSSDGDNVETVLDDSDLQNAPVFDDIRDSVQLPSDMNLNGLEIGTLYTETHIVDTEDGQEKQYEIVWWNIKHQFRDSGMRSLSPVTRLERTLV